MSKSMQVEIVRMSNQNFADDVGSDACDPLHILIAMEESEESEGLSGYGEHSFLVHHEPICFRK